MCCSCAGGNSEIYPRGSLRPAYGANPKDNGIQTSDTPPYVCVLYVRANCSKKVMVVPDTPTKVDAN